MNPFGLSSIGQIGISVNDVERAVEFYRDKLGMRFLFKAQSMAFFDCGGIRLLLGLPEANQEFFRSLVYYKVEDIEAAAEALKSRGIVFESDPRMVARMPDHDLWLAHFRDPDGNVLELMCEKKR